MKEGHVVCQESRKLNEHKKYYVTCDLELEMIIHALKIWRNYLLGRRFALMSDHSGLRYLLDQPDLNDRKSRWLAMVSEFDFEIRYIKGEENKVIDFLSRRIQVNHVTTVSCYGTDLKDQILQVGQQDGRYRELRHRLQQNTCDQDMDYSLTSDGLVRFRDMIYVPDNSELKKIILRECHAKPY